MKPDDTNVNNLFGLQIEEKEKRKLKARRENKRSVWAGFGVFGMIGWSVVIPALLGAALGTWLDKKYPISFSWTLTLMILGLICGCIIAWYWVAKEDKEMHKDKEETNE